MPLSPREELKHNENSSVLRQFHALTFLKKQGIMMERGGGVKDNF